MIQHHRSFQILLQNILILRMRDQDRSRTEQQRLAPTCEIGNVRCEANDFLFKSFDRQHLHRLAAGEYLYLASVAQKTFERLFDRLAWSRESDRESGFGGG